jgi:hypothetical protein
MIFSPQARKLALTVHVASCVGWLGALVAFSALSVASLVSQDGHMVQAADLGMGMTAWYVILPLGAAALVSGLVQALGSAWGLLRHYWVVAKLLLTVLAFAVLLLKLPAIAYLGSAVTEGNIVSADLVGLRRSLLSHAAGGLLVLLAATTLAVYKPQGHTAYAMPRWARTFAIALTALAIVVVIMLAGGGHGPGAHMPR